MSMFEIESADKVNLVDCKTSAEKMVKATGKVDQLTAERCSAGMTFNTTSTEKPSFRKRVLGYLLNQTSVLVMTIVGGIAVIVIASYFSLK